MKETEIKAAVVEALVSVAPDIAGEEIEPKTNFRDQFDFDSMDFLNFTIALHKKLGVAIPEGDYPRLSNLAGCLAYLGEKLAGKG